MSIRVDKALASARSKIDRLLAAGFALLRNDRKIIVYGQLLTALAPSRQLKLVANTHSVRE